MYVGGVCMVTFSISDEEWMILNTALYRAVDSFNRDPLNSSIEAANKTETLRSKIEDIKKGVSKHEG